ncbi:MAG: hypothetical protein M0R17_05225 [Candidatus Omnitrophica bacterium]|jgi:hypothetical protein|nr:hypothetical protein [Candidatus Omnitrophota bacterium]
MIYTPFDYISGGWTDPIKHPRSEYQTKAFPHLHQNTNRKKPYKIKKDKVKQQKQSRKINRKK